MSNKKPLLEIETLAPERPYVLIDDTRYDLRKLYEFSAAEHADWSRDSREYDSLWNANKRTKADEKRMEQLLDRLFDRVLLDAKQMRDDLNGRLTAPIKREIAITFSNAPLLMQAMAQMEEAEDKKPGNESSITES